MKQLIIISNENQLENLKRNNNCDNSVIIVTKRFLKYKCNDIFSDAKIIWYEDILSHKISWQECLIYEKKIFENINNIQMNKKNVFKDILGYKDYSFLEIDALRYLSGHRNLIANLFYKISVVELIITELQPDNVLMYYPYTEWDGAMEHVCNEKNIKIYHEKNGLTRRIRIYKNDHDFIELLKILKLLPLVIKLKNLYLIGRNLLSKVNPEKKFDVLLFSINTKYSDIILPLSRSLKNDYITPLVIIPSDSNYINLLNKEEIDYTILESYLDINILLNINPIYDQIIRNFNKIKNDNEFINAIQDICGTFIADKIIKEIEYSIIFSYYSLRYIFIIKKIINNFSSQLLFSTHFSENMVNSLFIGCKESKIPTIGLHRGTSVWQSEHSIFFGDKLLVSGEQSKEIFTSLGVKPNKIIITGFPIFDSLLEKLKNKNAIESKIREKFNISRRYTIVTYLTQSFGAKFGPQERENEIKMVFDSLKKFDDIFLLIKIHPTEDDTDIYEYYANKIGLKRYHIIYEGEYLDDILISSQIALTKNSTTGFNALIAKCKLLILNSDKSENFFLKENVAIAVHNKEELLTHIKNMRRGDFDESKAEKVKEFIEHHFYKQDYKSIDRIKKIIFQLINDN